MDMSIMLLIGALMIALVVVSICLCRRPKCSCSKEHRQENECCRKGLQFLSELAEAGLLAKKVEDSRHQRELERIKTEALMSEIHSLVFFGYLTPRANTLFKQGLESKARAYRAQAESDSYDKEAARAQAEVFEALLRELDGSWRLEENNESA